MLKRILSLTAAGTAIVLLTFVSLGQIPTAFIRSGMILTSGAAGGAVTGRAVFSASGGSISNLSTFGVISNVTRLGTGNFRITFSTPQSNYAVALTATDNNTATASCDLAGNNFATIQTSASSFDMYCTYGGVGAVGDPAVVTIAIM